MTEDCRINLYYPVTTIIYVFLHTKHQFKSFVLTGNDLTIQVDKINYNLKENDWNEIEEMSLLILFPSYTNIYDRNIKCQQGRLLDKKDDTRKGFD